MIKNKAAKALIIGTCLMVSSMASVYADTNSVEVKPAIVQEVNQEAEEMMTIQIESVSNEDALTQKQNEIDEYVFQTHKEELEKKGIIVLTTGVIADAVEIGIEPYNAENANYLYEIFGEDMVRVVEAEANVPLEYITMSAPVDAPQEEVSFFGNIFNNIVEWFKNIL